MKILVCLVLSLAIALAQTPPAPPVPPRDYVRPHRFPELWKQAPKARVFKLEPNRTEEGRPCSIPLTNVTPKVKSYMPIVPPEKLGKTVEMPHVEMPAPPCPE
jgi:hypothetical protein